MTGLPYADAVIGIFAYDTGCVSSGIRNEPLRQEIKDWIKAQPDDDLRLWLGRLVREEFLTEEALAAGYGPEDVHSFFQWMATGLDWDL